MAGFVSNRYDVGHIPPDLAGFVSNRYDVGHIPPDLAGFGFDLKSDVN
jgi:hypothetical protein